jgi:FkbM family methyltransferase
MAEELARRAPWSARLGRLRAFFWRFHTLRLAERLFGSVQGPCVLERPFLGYTLSVDVSRSNTHRLLYLEGVRFLGERELIASLLRPGQRVADVGANIGYYLLLFESLVGPGGKVDCIEPEADNLAELERNLRRNGFANARILPVAAGSSDGVVTLRQGVNGTVVPDGSGPVQVPLRRLDSVLEEPIDLLKVDVEGYEGHVLRGAQRLLARRRPTLMIEIHPGFLSPPYTIDDILGMIREVQPAIELHEISPQQGLAGRIAARYGGRAVRRVPDPGQLLADCRVGRRQEPFWAVARREPGELP